MNVHPFQVIWSCGGDGHTGGTVIVIIMGLTVPVLDMLSQTSTPDKSHLQDLNKLHI